MTDSSSGRGLSRVARARLAPGAQRLRRTTVAPLVACLVAVIALVAPACHSASSDPSTDAPADENDAGALGPPKWIGVPGVRLARLPSQTTATTTHFATSDVCAQCHLAGDGTALRDEKGRDVSPVGTWRTSAMALAARDPYYLAVFADELFTRPSLNLTIQGTCTRCHAPEGHVEMGTVGIVPTFGTLTTMNDTSKEAAVAREGVACTLCHQIAPTDLGTFGSFRGGFSIGDDRLIYGPYVDPKTDPMRLIVDYVPTGAPHIGQSNLCATCHTVITNGRDGSGAPGPNFPEQVPYVEWLASAFTTEPAPREKAAACQDCHMAAIDDDGATLDVPIAKSPPGLLPRKPFWRHGFAGANAQLSRFAASDPTWVGLPLTKEDHESQAQANEAMIRRAATVTLDAIDRVGDGLELRVRVANESGHKFPTGYPSRRAILHVSVETPEGVVFESGRTDLFGRLVTRDGRMVEPATFSPHLDVVDHEDQTQIYESVPVDATGKVAHRPLDSFRYGKDNRLLPIGFDPKSQLAVYAAPVGVDGDADWGSSDVVKYRVAKVPAGAKVRVELLFQVVRPAEIEALAAQPTPAARRLFDFATAVPPASIVVSSVDGVAP